jgi:hypothetical protein
LALLQNWILSGIKKRRKVGYGNRRNYRKMNVTWRPVGGCPPLIVVRTLVLTHTCSGHGSTGFKYLYSVGNSVFHGGRNRPGRDADPLPLSSAEV